MMAWRFMYWVFFVVGVIGVILGVAVFLRVARRPRSKLLIVTAIALSLAGLSGSLIVAAAGPGGFGRNMMGMGGMGMMGNPSDVRPAPPASAGAPNHPVRATEFAFSPTEFRVQAGVTVNVELRNEGSIFHTFTVTDLNFELEANGGQTTSGAFRAERVGTYEFVCSVPGHAQSGMRGRIIVG
jgi:nitrite reductase (NO-forming)